MGAKTAIMDAITQLQTSAPKGGEIWQGYEQLKRVAEKESDEQKLKQMAFILKEELKTASEEAQEILGQNLVKAAAEAPAPSPARRASEPRRRRR